MYKEGCKKEREERRMKRTNLGLYHSPRMLSDVFKSCRMTVKESYVDD